MLSYSFLISYFTQTLAKGGFIHLKIIELHRREKKREKRCRENRLRQISVEVKKVNELVVLSFSFYVVTKCCHEIKQKNYKCFLNGKKKSEQDEEPRALFSFC